MRKVLAFALTLAMLLTMAPQAVFADEQSGLDEIITVGMYGEEKDTCTVDIAVNNPEYGEVTETRLSVDSGTDVSVSGNTLTVGTSRIKAVPKAGTPQYAYEFDSWAGVPEDGKITENTTITAVFESSVNEYTIIWDSGDGTFKNNQTQLTTKAAFGTTPKAPEVPIKESDEVYMYLHDGWSPELEPVTGETIYVAKYRAVEAEKLEIDNDYLKNVKDVEVSYDGNQVVIKSANQACAVVAKLENGEYVRLRAVKRADDEYVYDLSDIKEDNDTFSLSAALKGDANLNGVVDMNDATAVMMSWVKDRPIGGAADLVARVYGISGKLTMDDATAIMLSWVNKTGFKWDLE